MESYQFYLDTKVSTWYRTKFVVEGNTLEEAKEAAIKLHKAGALDGEPWDNIIDTTEPMTPEENGNQPTEELFYNDEVINTNYNP